MNQHGGFYSKLTDEDLIKWENFRLFKNDCCPCVFKFLGMKNSEAEKLRSQFGKSGMTPEQIKKSFKESFPEYDFKFTKIERLNYERKRDMAMLKWLFSNIPKKFAIVSGFTRNNRHKKSSGNSSSGVDTGGHCVVLGKSMHGEPLFFDAQLLVMLTDYDKILEHYYKEKADIIYSLVSKNKKTNEALYFDRRDRRRIVSVPRSERTSRSTYKSLSKTRKSRKDRGKTVKKRKGKTNKKLSSIMYRKLKSISNKSSKLKKKLLTHRKKRKTLKQRQLDRRRGIKTKSNSKKRNVSKTDTDVEMESVNSSEKDNDIEMEIVN